MPAKVIAATPFSQGDKTEYPIRFAVGKYAKGTNPHDYVVGMQVKDPRNGTYFFSTAHYHTESQAMNTMLKLIARHNQGHTERWVSYIPPIVRQVK